MKTQKDKKRILLLLCGGTIASHEDTKVGSIVPSDKDLEPITKILKDMKSILKNKVKLDVKKMWSIDSTEMNKEHWEKITSLIEDNYSIYDGFLITMGTNTLAYAASALSFSVSGIQKPVIFTGSQIPAGKIASDARNNLINSIRVLGEKDLRGVWVVFGSKIIKGCRAKKASESALDAFVTFNAQDVGTIGIEIRLNANYNSSSGPKVFKPRNGFDDRIICITLIPGLRSEELMKMIDTGLKGVILRAYGSGDIPTTLHSALEYAQVKRVPVVVTTQCPGGVTKIGLNEPGRIALDYGIIPAFDMSMEAMTSKLMWLLSQGIQYENIKAEMTRDYVGEISR